MRKSTQRERRLSFAEITKDLSPSAEGQVAQQVSSDSKQREENWTPSSGGGKRAAFDSRANQQERRGTPRLRAGKTQNKMEFSPIRFLSPSPT